MNMIVTAKKNARKWTKERLKIHPGSWAIEHEEQSVSCWQGERAIHIKNMKDGWSGWFPVEDIEIREKV
jgi:hypothetical protein